MATPNTLDELETRIQLLPAEEQLWLIERLLRRMRMNGGTPRPDLGADLAAMAADPEIQHELRAIDKEFSPTELDGLEDAN